MVFHLLKILLCVCIATPVFCQTISDGSCGRNFSYDNAGNRIRRTVCYHSSLASPDEVKSLSNDGVMNNRIDNNELTTDPIVFPNPTNGIAYISNINKSSQLEVVVYDANGKEILRTQYSEAGLDLSHLPGGVYYFLFNYHSKNRMIKIIKTIN